MRRLLAALAVLAGCAAPQAPNPPTQAPFDWTQALEAAVLSYPEGAFTDGERLYVAEMGADQVRVFAFDGGDAAPWRLPACGPTALAPFDDGYVVLCHLSGDLAVVDASGTLQRRIGPADGVAIRNPNDGASDLHGGVYFSDPGDFYRPRQPVGRVVWLDPQGRLHEVARGLNYPNGVYVVAEGGQRFAYVSEHFARRILRYPIQADGRFGPMTVWASIPPQGQGARFAYDQAGPDGLERAADGTWHVAIYGEGRVLHLSAQGRVIGEFATPFQFVTNVTVISDGRLAIVGPYVHDRPPFRGGAVVARPAQFAAPER